MGWFSKKSKEPPPEEDPAAEDWFHTKAKSKGKNVRAGDQDSKKKSRKKVALSDDEGTHTMKKSVKKKSPVRRKRKVPKDDGDVGKVKIKQGRKRPDISLGENMSSDEDVPRKKTVKSKVKAGEKSKKTKGKKIKGKGSKAKRLQTKDGIRSMPVHLNSRPTLHERKAGKHEVFKSGSPVLDDDEGISDRDPLSSPEPAAVPHYTDDEKSIDEDSPEAERTVIPAYRPSELEDLPEELILQVYAQLDYKDQLQYARTSKKALFHVARLHPDLVIHDDESARKLDVSCLPHLERLDIINVPLVERLRVSRRAQLRRLVLSGCSKLPVKYIRRILDKNSKLEELGLPGCDQLGSFSFDGKGLTYLDLSGCEAMRNYDVQRLVDVNLDIETLLLEGLKHIRTIRLHGRRFGRSSTHQLVPARSAHSFTSSRAVLQDFNRPEASGLVTLSLSGCSELKSISIEDHPRLTNLHLGRLPLISSSSMIGLINSLPSIEVLDLSGNLHIEVFPLHSHTLRELKLSNCTNLKNGVLEGILHTCQNLEYLHFDGCTSLTEMSFESNSLRELCLQGFDEIPDVDIERSINGCPALETVDLSGLEQIETIHFGSESITTLLMTDVYNLRNVDIQEIVEECPNLETLHLNGCEQIVALRLQHEHLKKLDLTGVHGLKKKDYKRYMKLCPLLDSIEHD